MLPVLRRLATSPQPGEPTSFRYFYKDDVLVLDAKKLANIRRGLLSNLPRNRAYPKAPAAVARALWQQVSGERALEKGEEGFLDELTTDHRYVDFVEAWWPPVDAVELWRTLPKRVGELANGAFSREELDAMVTSWASGVPAIEDVPLVDELRYLLGEVPPDDERDDDVPRQLMSFERREREVENELRSTTSIDDDGYAHVLVDEAQDLSPMQWRMLGRRGRYASWTIVGDLAQSSWPHADEAEQARVAALEGKVEHRFRLSTNYRNSAEIYDLAADVAQVAIPGADLAEAVRRTGEAPRRRPAAAAGPSGRPARRPRPPAGARRSRHQGPGVRRGGRGRARRDHRGVRGRLADVLRRPHPRHPAPHHRRHHPDLALARLLTAPRPAPAPLPAFRGAGDGSCARNRREVHRTRGPRAGRWDRRGAF